MTLEELIRRFRALAKDTAQPYRCGDEDVIDWFNDAQAHACIRGRLIREDSMPSVCRITLLAGRATYALHPAAYELINLRLLPSNGDRARSMKLVSREWLDAEHPDWRDSSSPARWVIQDDTRIRVAGHFEAGDVLLLECYRLPLTNLENDMDEPEIHRAHHEHLIQWVLHKAFSIPDSEIFDPDRATLGERAFTAYFGQQPSSDMRRSSRHDVQHHIRAVLP